MRCWPEPRGWALLSAALVGCSGTLFHGASSVDREREPEGTLLLRLVTQQCRDGAGAPFTARPLSLVYLRQLTGNELLLERRGGYDSVAIHNVHSTARGRSFAYLSDSGKLAHRIEIDIAAQRGTLEVADTFVEHPLANGFWLELRNVALHCELEPEAARARTSLGALSNVGPGRQRAASEARPEVHEMAGSRGDTRVPR